MGDFAPLGYSLGILLFVGLCIPFALGFFMDVEDVPQSTFSTGLNNIINGNFSISVIPFTDFDDFNVNPFSWLGDEVRTTITNSVTYLGLLPDFLLVFILIMCTTGILYGVIKLLPTT